MKRQNRIKDTNNRIPAVIPKSKLNMDQTLREAQQILFRVIEQEMKVNERFRNALSEITGGIITKYILSLLLTAKTQEQMPICDKENELPPKKREIFRENSVSDEESCYRQDTEQKLALPPKKRKNFREIQNLEQKYDCCKQMAAPALKIAKREEFDSTRERDSSRIYSCDLCERIFQDVKKLKNHEKRHRFKRKQEHICHICRKRFTQPSGLKQHILVHTGERPHKCNYCPNTFSDKSTLKKHERIHTKERPYKCKVCSENFSQSGNLLRHIRNKHKMELNAEKK